MGETALSGMKAIVDYCGAIGLPRTESSIIQLKQQCGFPMKKLMGIWESDKELIVAWRKQYIAGEVSEPSQPARKKTVSSRGKAV